MAKVQLRKKSIKANIVVQSTRISKVCFKQSEIKEQQPFESIREQNGALQEICNKSNEEDGEYIQFVSEEDNIRKRVYGNNTENSNSSSFTINKAENINTNISSTKISSITTNRNNNEKTEECEQDCKIADKSRICDENNITNMKCTDKQLTLPSKSLNAQRVTLTAKQATSVIAADKERSEHVNCSLFPSLTAMLTCKGG